MTVTHLHEYICCLYIIIYTYIQYMIYIIMLFTCINTCKLYI